VLVLKPTSRFILKENIILQGMAELDHYYAFDTKSGDHYQLNHTAYWVLKSIGSGINFQQLVDKFAQAYNLQHDTAQEDLQEILQNAFDNDIIKEATS
jgi:hypothetical protein